MARDIELKRRASRILIISDNPGLRDRISPILDRLKGEMPALERAELFQSGTDAAAHSAATKVPVAPGLDVRAQAEWILENFDLVLSLHCKQIFPAALVNSIPCINFHPGFNPFNRGWFPHVFSIINKRPAGITVHLMDEKIDHGPVLFQQEVPVLPWDTSGSLYERIIDAEVRQFEALLPRIVEGDWTASELTTPGNLNTKRDFAALCRLDLSKTATYGEVIDVLRALTHAGHKNAYFLAPDGRKVFIALDIEAAPPG